MNPERPRQLVSGFALVLIALGTAWAGGGRSLPLVVLPTCALLLWLLLPPDCRRSRPLGWIFLFLSLWPFAAFLPSSLAPAAAWREQWEPLLGTMITPQPVETMRGIAGFEAGLAIAWWVLGHGWKRENRRVIARAFALLGTAIVGIAIFAERIDIRVPGWLHSSGIGPFLSRNQMGTFIALVSVIAVGLTHSCVLRRRPEAILWMACIGVCGLGAVVNGSRGGLLLFLLAFATYGLFSFWSGKRNPLLFAVGVAPLLLTLAVFLLGWGTHLASLLPRSGLTEGPDFRLQVHRDAVEMVRDNPMFGVGLGNFDEVFAHYRAASLNEYRTWHPESDWLWSAADLGLPGFFAMLLALGLVLRACFLRLHDFSDTSAVAGFSGVALFLLHAFFDVPAHESAMALCGLVCLGLCWPGAAAAGVSRQIERALICAGLAALLIATVLVLPPDRASEELRTARRQLAEDQFEMAAAAAGRVLQTSPLHAEGRHVLGLALAGMNRDEEAWAELRNAARLEPGDAYRREVEAFVLASTDPPRAGTLFAEAVRLTEDERLRRQRLATYLKEYRHPARSELMDLAFTEPGLAAAALLEMDDAAFRKWVSVLERSPDPELRQLVVAAVAERSGMDGLAVMKDSPEAKREMARTFARAGKLETACALAFELIPTPSLPPLPSETIDGLRKARLFDPHDAFLAASLARKWIEDHQYAAALRLLREIPPGHPDYAWYLKARAAAGAADWESAWKELEPRMSE